MTVFAVKALGKKHALTAICAPSFYLAELGLVATAASLFSILKYHDFSMTEIWLVFWLLNLFISGVIVRLNDRFEADITLMQSLRGLIDAAIVRSRWIGFTLETVIVIRLLIWDGPSQLLIFFRNRIKTDTGRFLFLTAASGFQMFIWTDVYSMGYDNFFLFFENTFSAIL
jgi:hypothetical protein